MWLKLDKLASVAGYQYFLFQFLTTASPYVTHRFNITTSDELGCYFWNVGHTASAARFTSSIITSTNIWYHLVCVHNGAGNYPDIYVNGSLVNIDASKSSIATTLEVPTAATSLGQNYDGDTEVIQGSMDEIAMWNRALTSTEVTSLYNMGHGNQYPFVWNNIVSYWELNETSGNAIDSVSGYDGTWTSGLTQNQSGKLGTSYEFYNYATPNSTFGLHCGDHAVHHLTTGGTINAWVYHNFGAYYGGMVAGNEDQNQDRDGYALTVSAYGAPDNEPRVAADFGDDSSWLHVMGNTHVTEGAWHMVTLTWDSNIRLYLDGTSDAVSGRTVTPTFTGAYTEFCIGRSPSIYSPAPFCKMDAIPGTGKGKIDSVGLWSRALTAAEITTLYNSGTGTAYLPSDNFDSYTATAALGGQGPWLTTLNDMVVVDAGGTNHTVAPNDGGLVCICTHKAVLSNNQWAQVTVGAVGAGSQCIGVAVRLTGTTATSCGYGYYATNNTQRLWRLDNGVKTNLGTNNFTALNVGDTLKLVITGSTLMCYFNGVLDTVIGSGGGYTTDTTYTTIGKAGICGYDTSTTTGNNWSAGNA
jgi:hypothetical protein